VKRWLCSQGAGIAFVARTLNGLTEIKFVNTSLHGVGNVFVNQSFERFGFKPFIPVKEQQHPDPEFPSVKFPNPEEAGMSHYLLMTDGTDGQPIIMTRS
jgi:phosphomannomutase